MFQIVSEVEYSLRKSEFPRSMAREPANRRRQWRPFYRATTLDENG